jgi:hypothetical protein
MAEKTIRMIDDNGYEYIIGAVSGFTYGSTNPEWHKRTRPNDVVGTVTRVLGHDEQGRQVVEVRVNMSEGE